MTAREYVFYDRNLTRESKEASAKILAELEENVPMMSTMDLITYTLAFHSHIGLAVENLPAATALGYSMDTFPAKGAMYIATYRELPKEVPRRVAGGCGVGA